MSPDEEAEGAQALSPEYAKAVSQAVAAVRERMAHACKASGRGPEAVQLLAVTKFNPPEAVLAAYAAGVRLFGENRVQEAESKLAALGGRVPDARFHLLGHLQSNKARKAVTLFGCVQSVDSIDIVRELGKRAASEGRVLDVLMELHTGEESKTGFSDTDSFLAALEEALGAGSLRPRGVMTMAPYTDDEKAIRSSFRACRAAFELAKARLEPPAWDTLSMGMTNDYTLAIEEGATMVRIGTAVFGQRRPL